MNECSVKDCNNVLPKPYHYGNICLIHREIFLVCYWHDDDQLDISRAIKDKVLLDNSIERMGGSIESHWGWAWDRFWSDFTHKHKNG